MESTSGVSKRCKQTVSSTIGLLGDSDTPASLLLMVCELTANLSVCKPKHPGYRRVRKFSHGSVDRHDGGSNNCDLQTFDAHRRSFVVTLERMFVFCDYCCCCCCRFYRKSKCGFARRKAENKMLLDDVVWEPPQHATVMDFVIKISLTVLRPWQRYLKKWDASIRCVGEMRICSRVFVPMDHWQIRGRLA